MTTIHHEDRHDHMAPRDVDGHLGRDHRLDALLEALDETVGYQLWTSGGGLTGWAYGYLMGAGIDVEGMNTEERIGKALHEWDHRRG